MSEALQLLTNSRRNSFNKCCRRHFYEYEQGIRPVKTGDALRFGSLFHGALEQYVKTNLVAALLWLDQQQESDYNAYEKELAKQLMVGYDKKWKHDFSDDAVPEVEFRAPLLNPATMHESQTFMLAGKIDVVLPAKKQIIEHKTTSDDISPESDYWLGLIIDGQISGYYAGAMALGYEIQSCIYDVIRKPAQRPLQATPVESRKFTRDGRLYAAQRESDENVADYGARVGAEIAEKPDRYYARHEVPRLEEDMVDYYTDMWACGREIRENQLANRWPRNPQACLSFGRCPYFGVCTKTEMLEDTELFVKVGNVNQELPSTRGTK